MTANEFNEVLNNCISRTKTLLETKASEYALSSDRLSQFKTAAKITGESPAQSLRGMMVKHYISISDMCDSPASFSLSKWQEKLDDLRNYTILLEGVLHDLGIE